uniref:histidine kinase n=1 Tax=Geobacter metallireducens TaxID=28232 RepID=A0A831UA03_GEOME
MMHLSLKTRMALGVTLLFLVLGTVLGYGALAYFQQKLKESIFTHQMSMTASLAADLDSRLSFAQNSLAAFAPKLPPEVIRNVDTLQRILDSKTTLHLLFDTIVVFGPDGRLIAESPYLPARRGLDFSYREYFKKSVATGKPQISNVYPSTARPGHPAVMLTCPLFDARGNLAAILAGNIDLQGNSFLAKLGVMRIGKGGYVTVFDGNRKRLMHPDRRRIMERVPAGVNTLFDRAAAGFEGSGETVSADGVAVLSSYKRLRTVDWLMGISYPLDEAYASLYRARAYFAGSLAAGLILILLLTWHAMQRLTAPLSRLTGHVEAFAADPEGQVPVPVESRDELGVLAASFNAMMEKLRDKQESLRQVAKRAEDERARFEAIIGALGEGLSIQDRNYRILVQNDVHRRLSGGDHVGEYCYQAYRNRDQVCDDCVVALCFADGKPHTRVYENLPGHPGKYLEFNVTPLRDAGGEIVACIELVRDITERMRAEERIRTLNADLERRVAERTEELNHSVREMETFCYTVSHDLRTPLRGINGFSAILQQEYADRLDEEGKEYLRRIAGAANRMAELIDDLLELSRVNRDELRLVPVDLAPMAREIAAELMGSNRERQVEFVIEPELRATGDPSLLGAALSNLMHNAWKFSARNPAARIEVGSRQEWEERVFFVRDNGVGFDMAYGDKLFLPFHRLHAAEGFEGTGIGLATVQRIIERHGGRVWAEGEPGKGAVFFFTLAG